MGSLEIWELGFRRGFAFIGIFGKKTCSEERSKEIIDHAQVT